MLGRSAPSERMSLRKTTATSAARAASTAALSWAGSGAPQPSLKFGGNNPPNGDVFTYSTRIDTGVPAGRSSAAMVSWLLVLNTSLSSMYSRAVPLPLSEKRCRPDTVGVKVPVQRADHVPDSPAGLPVTWTVGSMRVIAGEPLRSDDVKYSAFRPAPVPEAGVSVEDGASGGS